jgi:hypothetical protein
MKKQLLLIGSLCLLIGSAVAPMYAQTAGVQVQVKVPFDFTVSRKVFLAGEYTMTACPLGVAIQDDHGTMVAMALANGISGRSATRNGQTVFHCYNGRCFLSEVWSPNGNSGRQLLPSQAEAELAGAQSQNEFVVPGEMSRK